MRNLLSLSMLLLINCLLLVGCEKDTEQITVSTDAKQVQVELNTPMSFDQLENLIHEMDIVVRSIEMQQPEGGLWEKSIVTGSEGLQELRENIETGRTGMIQDILKDDPDDIAMEIVQDIQEQPASLIKYLSVQLNSTSKSEVFSKLDAVEIKIAKPDVEYKRQKSSSRVPSFMLVQAYDSDQGVNDRYLIQVMSWNSSIPFGSGETFEPDLFLNNYSASSRPGTYLSREVSYWGFPVTEYAASNLPSAYLDTRFFDGNDFDYNGDEEIAYTIGSGSAEQIIGDKSYYTYMRLEKGDANSDSAKLNAQEGTQIPKGCVLTWCSFGTNTTRISQGTWPIILPGRETYTP